MPEGIVWWFTYGGGFLSGALVTAVACGKVRAVSRWLDRLLDEDELTRRAPQRSIPLPRDWECHPN